MIHIHNLWCDSVLRTIIQKLFWGLIIQSTCVFLHLRCCYCINLCDNKMLLLMTISSHSYVDWVLSHCAYFIVRKFICLSVCILCVFVPYCIVVVLL